ncbi:MAG: ATP-binding protein [Lactobacillaceae bacterium]|jgi:predicted AAA+ superfamily ATPase|nr:ATP-binding protein [Lactobacillaceae bacterium]
MNPFSPTFDFHKDSFINNDVNFLRNIKLSLSQLGNPWRTTFILGMRRSGKTTLLSYLKQQLSSEKDTVVISFNSSPNILVDILAELQDRLSKKTIDKLNLSFTAFGLSAGIDLKDKNKFPSFQLDLKKILEEFKKQGLSVLLLLDEVQNNTQELRTLFSAYKIVYSEYQINIVAAGLPSAIDSLINDDALTFLLRSNRIELEPLTYESILMSYKKLFNSRNVTLEQLQTMTEATSGYPFVYQLIGYYVWNESEDAPVTDEIIDGAIKFARKALFDQVYSKVYSDLPNTPRELVLAIHELGDHQVSNKQIQDKLGWDLNKVSSYKATLTHWGIIEKEGYGITGFKPPYFDQFLDYYFS